MSTLLANWKAHGYVDTDNNSWAWTDKGKHEISATGRSYLSDLLYGLYVPPNNLKWDGFGPDGMKL